MVDLNDFEIEIECDYKDEHYSVRDNGSVMRHTPLNRRERPIDNKWTFGKENVKTGYLEIASVRIHRIVANAFYGEPPTKEHVVDHIDTNKQNNRPDNLRWVTRLENILLNPITVKRIEMSCGCSIEEFLANPSKFRDKFQEPNYSWMCTVSIEEAQESKKRFLAWAESDMHSFGGSLGEWIFTRNSKIKEMQIELTIEDKIQSIFERVEKETGVSKIELSSASKKDKYYKARVYAAKLLRSEVGLLDEKISSLVGRSKSMVNAYFHTPDYTIKDHYDSAFNDSAEPNNDNTDIIRSSTSNAVQKNWITPSEFPCCPRSISIYPIKDYISNLVKGEVFSQNKYTSSIIEDFAISNDENTLWIVCKNIDENANKPYTLTEVTFQNNLFVHNCLGSFFNKEYVEKQFTLAQGLEWSGEDTFEDYC